MLLCQPVIANHQTPTNADSTDPPQVIRIGVHAYRSLEAAEYRWQATADYLHQAIPEYNFAVAPMRYQNLRYAIAKKQVDFVLTHPDEYVNLNAKYGLKAIATLIVNAQQHPVAEFGGVIFTRSDNDAINSIADLRGHSLISARDDALGVYIAQQWTLYKAGIDTRTDLGEQRFIGPPQDNTVLEVLKGNADIGFVRTGILESMVREGKIRADQFKVINRQPRDKFPLLLSTDLYPEWPIAMLPHISDELGKKVSMALQKLEPSDQAAQLGRYYGFAPAHDYSPIEAVMLRLNIHPKSEQLALQQIIEPMLRAGIVVLTVLLLVGLLILIRFRRLNSSLLYANATLKQNQIMLERLGEGVYCMDRSGNTIYVNPAALKMLGYRAAEVLGQPSHALFHHSHADGSDYPIEHCPVFQTLQDGRQRQTDDWFIGKDGTPFPVELSTNAITENDEITSVVVVFSDISEQQYLLNQIHQQRTLLQSVIDATPDLIFFKNSDSVYLGCNKAFEQFVGTTIENIQGKTDFDLFDDKLAAFFQQQDQMLYRSEKPHKNEEWVTYPGGIEVLLETVKTPFFDTDAKLQGLVGVSRDITQRKMAEQQAERMAFHDSLTQLPNRRLLVDRLERAQAESARRRSFAALMMLDLDHFKEINDNAGHDAGDEVLINVAQQLQHAVREIDTVARLGGDEFVIVLEDLGPERQQAQDHAARIAEVILRRLDHPYRFNAREFYATPSIGICLLFEHQQSQDQLLKAVDLAMYDAKSSGGNCYRFSNRSHCA